MRDSVKYPIQFRPADGAFYILADAKELINKLQLKDDVELCSYLPELRKVSCVPGSAFGAPMHIRLSFAIKKTKINEAFDRIEELLA